MGRIFNIRSKESYFKIIFIVILLSSAILRFYDLDFRIFHNDESRVAARAYWLFKDGMYTYEPMYHGPFIYYSTAFMFNFFGANEFAARFLPALFGVALVAAVYLFRKYIGDSGVLFTAFLFAFSPSFLYYSRFFREDIFIALFSLLIVFCSVKYLELRHINQRLSLFYLVLISALTAVSASTKESTYVLIAIFLSFVGIYLIAKKIRKKDSVFKGIKYSQILAEIVLFVIIFLTIFSLFYTGGSLSFESVKTVFEKAIDYWFGVHKEERLAGPFYYYFLIIATYELPMFIFGVLGIVYCSKKSTFLMFLSYWAITSFIIYSYLQEKVPWLVLSILLPLAVIAGKYVDGLLSEYRFSKNRIRVALMFILILTSILMVYSSITLNFNNYTDASELLVQNDQPPQQFMKFINDIYDLSHDDKGSETFVQIADMYLSKSALMWYMRYYNNVAIVGINSQFYPSIRLQDDGFNAPIIVLDEADYDLIKDRLDKNYNIYYYTKLSRYEVRNLTFSYVITRKREQIQKKDVTVLAYPKNQRLNKNGSVLMKTGFDIIGSKNFSVIWGKMTYYRAVHNGSQCDCFFTVDIDNDGKAEYIFYQYYDWWKPMKKRIKLLIPDSLFEEFGEPVMVVVERIDSNDDDLLDITRIVYETRGRINIVEYK